LPVTAGLPMGIPLVLIFGALFVLGGFGVYALADSSRPNRL